MDLKLSYETSRPSSAASVASSFSGLPSFQAIKNGKGSAGPFPSSLFQLQDLNWGKRRCKDLHAFYVVADTSVLESCLDSVIPPKTPPLIVLCHAKSTWADPSLKGSMVVTCDRQFDGPLQTPPHKTSRLRNEKIFTEMEIDRDHLESQWRDYFRNASQWIDNPNTKNYLNTQQRDAKEDILYWTPKKQRKDVGGEDQVFGVEEKRMVKKLKRTAQELLLNGTENQVGEDGDPAAFVASLKECGSRRDLQRGSELHEEIVTRGWLGNDLFVSNNLLSMYVKCGALAKAQAVFDELTARDIVSWNVLVSGYAKHGDGEQALRCFQAMKSDGFPPNMVTMLSILKACDNLGSLNKGFEIHAEIAMEGFLEEDVRVGTALLDMYAKLGLLSEAQDIFDELPIRDVAAWTSLIGGYAHHGNGEKALFCFELMQSEGFLPNALTFVCDLKACGSLQALEKGKALHAQIAQDLSLKNNVHIGTALVDMYAKCDQLEKSQEVFDELPVCDVATWTALISGYAQFGHGEKAIHSFEQMQLRGFSPNVVTFISILKACGTIGAFNKGQDIHAQILKQELVEDFMVANGLVDMYVKCGMLGKAQKVFDELKVRTVVTWNALMSGYAQHADGTEALNCFEQMQLEGISPDAVSFACILKACARIGAAIHGLEFHADIEKVGLLGNDIFLGTALVDMYAQCGMLSEAQDVFVELQGQDVVSWTALIGGYAEYGHGEKALNCFKHMQGGGFVPNAITFVCILKACAGMEALEVGREIHAQIAAEGLYEGDIHVGGAIVDMYAKCGSITDAQCMFDELTVRDKVSWTALIFGYAQQGDGEEALKCFESMQSEGFFPDAITFTCVLKSCGCIGAASRGQLLHDEIARDDFIEKDLGIGTAIVDMYANSGMLTEAQEVFDSLRVRDEISWNVLMAGYAQLGKDKVVFDLLEKMVREGKEPELVTFHILLNTCSHGGLLDEGQAYFEIIMQRFGIDPDLKHFMCMIDLFCRAGHLGMVVTIIHEMPYRTNLTLWHSLLSACREWGNLELGEWAFRHATQLNRKDSGAYVSMGNISLVAGRK